MKKILFWQHCPPGRGTYIRAYEIGRRLADSGNLVFIGAPDPGLERAPFEVVEDEYNPFLRIVRIGCSGSFGGQFVRVVRGAINSRRWIRDEGMLFDIGHFFAMGHPFNAFSANFMAKQCQRCFLDWDDLWGEGLGLHAGFLQNKLMGFFETNIARRLSPEGVTTVSDFLKDRSEIFGLSSEKIWIIGNGLGGKRDAGGAGVAVSKFEDAALPVVSIGNTYSPDSLRIMLCAFEAAHEIVPDLKLFLIGDFRKPGRMGRLIERVLEEHAAAFGEYVFELGGMPETEMHECLAESRFVILPMDSSPADMARFPIRLGPYLSHRKLIVSNAVGEVSKILGSYQLGLLSPVGDVEAFSQNIVTAARAYDQVGSSDEERFDNILRKYSWDSLAERWSEVYR